MDKLSQEAREILQGQLSNLYHAIAQRGGINVDKIDEIALQARTEIDAGLSYDHAMSWGEGRRDAIDVSMIGCVRIPRLWP